MEADAVALVRESLLALQPDPGLTVDLFYMRLFAIAPQTRELFPDDMTAQNAKFRDMLLELVALIDEPEALRQRLRDLGRRHARYGVRRGDYALVEEALMWALAQQFGDRYGEAAIAAWRELYRSFHREMLQPAG